jgi:hypothetical protein
MSGSTASGYAAGEPTTEDTIRTRLVTALGTIAAAAAIAGCGSDDKDRSEAGPSDRVHKSFTASCLKSGGNKEDCECVYDNLTQEQGIDTDQDFQALADKITSGTTGSNAPPEFRKAAQACGIQ